jgi:hypothetical protein
MYCARHPKIETAVSCGRCSAPICTKCMVPGAVGMLCRACATNRPAMIYEVAPPRLALAGVVGLAAGVAVGFLLQTLTTAFVYFSLFIGPILGSGVGYAVWYAAGRKRGLPLELIAGGAVLVGAAIALLITGQWAWLLRVPLSLALYGVGLALAVASAVGKIRFY